MGHHEPSPTLDESQGVDDSAWVLSFLQMPVVFTVTIFGISVDNISNYTTMRMGNGTPLIGVSLAE
jgi:hypothetical protein